MEELLKCRLCKFPFDMGEKQPVILKCGFTFCEECVISRNQNLFECISCGMVHDFNNDSFYVTNHLVLQISSMTNKSESGARKNNSPSK
jgi:hypothetical protein